MSIRLLFLGVWCCLAVACPPLDGLDGGSPEGDDADAGADGGDEVDAGVAADGGPEQADGGGSDAGAGEGEGECVELFGLTDQLDDAGVIHYEDCGWPFVGTCNDGSCAATDAERQLIDLILEVAIARGYSERLQIVQVNENPGSYVRAQAVLIADWARAQLFVQGEVDEGGQLIREYVEAALPLQIPTTLPSIDVVLGRLRECAPDVRAKFCGLVVDLCPWRGSAVLEGYGGYGTPMCEAAILTLWDSCTLDAGPAEVTCYPGGAPCCE